MNIAFVGLSGVPYSKRACDTRLLAFAQAFIRKGHRVYIFNRIASKVEKEEFGSDKLPEGLSIIELSHGRRKKNLLFIVYSFLREYVEIIKFNRRQKIDILHVYNGHFIIFLCYYLLSIVLRAKMVYQYVEYRSAIKRSNFYHLVNGILCDKFLGYFFNGIICISNFLEKEIQSKHPNQSTIKVPPICDFNYFNSVDSPVSEENFILYCGSVEYMEVINFIIESYNTSNCRSRNVKLILIVSGSTKKIENLTNMFQSDDNISIRTNLRYDDLIRCYKNAMALLIPLRNTIQDIARFPNKICEYSASSNVIITTNVGEIPYYFRNKYSALIADNYSVDKVADEINWLLNHSQKRNEISENAFLLGQNYFDIRSYEDKLHEFLTTISCQ